MLNSPSGPFSAVSIAEGKWTENSSANAVYYDGKVNASSLEFNNASELNEKIMRGVEKAYKMTETEVTNATHVEKVI